MKTTGIYLILNTLNGNKYIGSTSSSFYNRFSQHQSGLKGNKHRNGHLQKAWNKYGESVFKFIILEEIPKEEFIDNNYLTDVEQMYLDAYNPEYNICKIARSRLGVKQSSESSERCRQAKLGTHHTDESKKKISKTLTGIKRPGESREVLRNRLSKKYVVTYPNNFKEIITNLSNFCRIHNLGQANLNSVAQGKRKQHKGFKCEYYNN